MNETTVGASAGPRVSDEQLANMIEDYADPSARSTMRGVVTYCLVNDLADSRTALAAANARIAVLEAERDGAYSERNQVVLLAAALASNQWMPVWVSRDPSEPDWPVLGIDLEREGQITWHLPPGTDTSIAYSPPEPWDGHTTEEKYARIRAFVEWIAGTETALATASPEQGEDRADSSTNGVPT